MPTALLGALLFGALTARMFSAAQTFHPGLFRRWLRRSVLGLSWLAVATASAAGVVSALRTGTFSAPTPMLTLIVGMMIWFVALSAFAIGYRFANGRRMLKALDSGIAVGLH